MSVRMGSVQFKRMKAKVVAAVAGIDRAGNVLTTTQLNVLAESAVGKQVTFNFDPRIAPIGKVLNAEIDNDKLIVEVELYNDKFSGCFIAPSYRINKNGTITSLDYAVVKEHSDLGATKL